MPFAHHPCVQSLAEEPWFQGKESLAEKHGLKHISEVPIALSPPMNFPRLVAQSSAFTIHPEPQPGKMIEDLLTQEWELVRYEIPSGKKHKLLGDLKSIGISRHTLFQNLDSLSESIFEAGVRIAYAPPSPPPCGGEITHATDD